MATQRRFEGATLAAVLAEVQKEVGADAKIASAQKVRSGGFAGFFQRERFEVIVDVGVEGDVEDETKAESESVRAPEQKSPASLLEIAEAINNSEGGVRTAPAPAAEHPPFPVDPAVSEPRRTTVSTESDVFAEVLSRVAYQADMRSPAPTHPLIPDRPAILDEPTPEPSEPEKPEAKPSEPEKPEAKPEPEPDTAPDTAEEVPVVIVDSSVVEEDAEVSPEATNEIVPAAEPQLSPVRTRITDSPLSKLGLPTEYIPIGVDGARLHATLVSALQRLPKAPDIKPSRGSVIVVMGERAEAVELARDLSERWGRPPEDVVLASQTFRGRGAGAVLRTVRNAEDAKRSWSRRSHATVVALDAHPGSGESGWAKQMLAALEPIGTFGIANATRKAEDIAAWADALGGIDALVVNHVDETISPASVLSTGIPVDRIDGRKASPEYWAMLLMDRLNAV